MSVMLLARLAVDQQWQKRGRSWTSQRCQAAAPARRSHCGNSRSTGPGQRS